MQIRIGLVVAAAAIVLVVGACKPDTAKDPATSPASALSGESDEGLNVLAADPAAGFSDFKAIGTDGVTTPDCCKVPGGHDDGDKDLKKDTHK